MAGKAPTSTSTSTAIPTSILIKSISFVDIVKKGFIAIEGILLYIKIP
jgi:riboflavin synthase alpha subunit